MMQTKQPSPELMQMIKTAASSLLGFGELWGSIKIKGRDEGFDEKELQDMLRPYLKEKLDSKKIWYLFHKEEQIERVQNQQRAQNRTKFSTNDDKKSTEQSTSPPKETPAIAKVEAIDKNNDLYEPEEDPKDAEIQFLKDENAQLKGALKQTTEFKPASQVGFTKEDVGLDTVVFRMGIKDPKRAAEVISNEMTEFIKKGLTGLRNRGWETVEVTMRIL